MIETLLDPEKLLAPFHSGIMVRAILAAMLIAVVCGALSCFITLKGWSLMGDALAHAIVPGVSLAYLGGIPFAVGAFVAGILAALSMGYVKSATRIREDAVIGIVFTTFFALGLFLISKYPTEFNLKSIIQGNIIGIAARDLWQMLIISGVTLLIIALKWRDLVLVSFDPIQAKAVGLNVRAWSMLLLAMLAATAIAALQTVGPCLVVAMLVTPGATAYLLTDRFGRMMWLAMGLGALTAFLGSYASWFVGASVGGCIVVLQTLVFLAVLALAPKHGMLAARRRIRAARAANLEPDTDEARLIEDMGKPR